MRAVTNDELRQELDEMRNRLKDLESCKASLQSERARYERLLESAPDAMLFVDKNATIIHANAQLETLFGYAERELEGRDLHSLIPERYRGKHRGNMAGYFANPTARPMGTNLQIYALKKDGSEFPADISLSPLRAEGELLVIAAIRDISDRRRAESMIERNYQVQKIISAMLKISLEPVSFDEQLNRALSLILALPGLEKSRGYIYLAGKNAAEFTLSASQPGTEAEASVCAGMCERIVSGRCAGGDRKSQCVTSFVSCVDGGGEIRFSRDDGRAYYCLPIVSGSEVLGLLTIFLESSRQGRFEEEEFLVTIANTVATIVMRNRAEIERNAFRDQLAETEKIAALGRITANVAHDIRNPLTAIGGFARRLSKISAESKQKEYANFIASEVTRLEKILRTILSYSRGTRRAAEECDLNEIISEALKIFEETCREQSIVVNTQLKDIPRLTGDREQLLEAVENLISNAIEAMPRGGMLTIVTREEKINELSHVTVRIIDTGEGIRQEDMSRIFEPFFSTKVAAKGAGLGLSIAKKVVEDHGGAIHVETSRAAGTTFVLRFRTPVRQAVAR